MNTIELQIVQEQGWRFCRIDYAKKGPTYSNWQNTPYLLQSIPTTGNVGVITGEHSNGLLAIDFDGPWASAYYQKNINIDLPETVTWTSGRDSRWQMAYTVPQELWSFMRTFKIVEPGVSVETHGRKPDGLEFRWNGVQSVLPPSMHPDTHKPYSWVNSPLETVVAECPVDLLDWMLQYAPPVVVDDADIIEVTIDDLTIDKLEECEAILLKIKQHEVALAYDDWIRVTWSTVAHIGTEAGIALMRSLWPEQKTGEYKKLMHGFSIAKSPKFGSLVHRAASHNIHQPQTTKRIFGANPKTRRIAF